MGVKYVIFLLILNSVYYLAYANNVLGCGGFIKSHIPLDFSKIEVKLVTKQGIVKDRTTCAPNNGYYFLPIYDKGEVILQLSPPPGWSFTPKEIQLNIDGTDPCSQEKDINFVFEGFGITGKVESLGASTAKGPKGVTVQLSYKGEVKNTVTNEEGRFLFSPVFPGTYTVSISHPKWKIYKKTVTVVVAEGNSDLPEKSLVVQGYEVKGRILTAEGDPVKDTVIVLFSKDEDKNVLVDKCEKSELSGYKFKNKPLCRVTSNSQGEFVYPVVPHGKYYVVPYYKEQNIYFQPERLEFSVEHDDTRLTEDFHVIGFSVPGKVNNGKGRPIANAKIYLNGQKVATTDTYGHYKLERLKVGKYAIKAEADNLIFEEMTVNINTNLPALPDIIPSAFKVCGEVISDKRQVVTFTQSGSSKFVQTDTNSEQQFCQYLAPGLYDVQVSVVEEDRKNGLQFFPLKQTIEVKAENIFDLVFSQLKANISGLIQCIEKKDCVGLFVNIKSGVEEVTVAVKDSKYLVTDMHPGTYEIILLDSRLCWKTTKHVINVNTALVEAPTFIQTGYSVNLVSSHDTKIQYQLTSKQPGSKVTELNLNKGVTPLCLEHPGEYNFILSGCHTYESDNTIYNTASSDNQIMLNAVKHTVTASIASDTNFGAIDVVIQIGSDILRQKVAYNNGKYDVNLMLKPLEIASITPESDFLFFTPATLNIEGGNDCQDLGNTVTAVKGRVFKGQIKPPLAGVTVTVEGLTDGNILTVETDNNGYYKLPPLNNKFQYKVSAVKESYILSGPDKEGNFVAQKLAEINVEVLDEVDKTPLQGVLLSLSGGQSYRKNLQTDANGKISFFSLSASDYFLRPMMKEYQFEPNSRIIKVKEGETVNLKLTGKRVAFSAFGKITSLNEEPVENVNVIASGTGNCTQFTEEATTDASGHFRIRGLQPYCSFKVFVQVSNDSEDSVERTSPESIEINNIDEDIKDLHIIVFRPVVITDVLVKVFADNADHYRSLKLKLFRETDGPAQLYSGYVDNSNIKVDKNRNYGILIHLPSVHLDKKTYSVHLEPAHSAKGRTQVEYFVANTSFVYKEMYFNVKSVHHEQPIKQTSIWAVVCIFVFLILVYNIQVIFDLLKQHLNFNISDLSSYIPIPSSARAASDYDNDIDQIVQDINNVRKNRSKKVN